MIPKGRPYNFPLKITTKNDFASRFGIVLNQQLDIKVLSDVKLILKDMQNIRDQIDYSNIQKLVNFDPSQLDKEEYHIINYLRYVYFVDNYFNSIFSNNKLPNIVFAWTDSFRPKEKSKISSHIKFELLNILYNLAIIYFIEGSVIASIPFEEDVRRSMEKFNTALWALQDYKVILPFIPPDMYPLLADMEEDFINFLQNYIKAVQAAAWTVPFPENPDYEQLAAASANASHNFKLALDDLNKLQKNPMPELEYFKLKFNLEFNARMHMASAFYNMGVSYHNKGLKNLSDEERTYVVEYIERAMEEIGLLLQNKDELENLEADQNEDLFKLQEKIGMISSSYPANRKKVMDLPEIPSHFYFSSPTRPKDFYTPLIKDQSKLMVLLPPELMNIKNSFDTHVALEASGADSTYEKLRNVKNKLFNESCVDALIALEEQAQSNKVQVPAILGNKITQFRHIGGMAAFEALFLKVLEKNSQCRDIIQEIEGTLAMDHQDESKIPKNFKESYDPMKMSDSFNSCTQRFKKLQEKFIAAQVSDKDIQKKFNANQEWAERFATLKDQEILDVLLKDTDSTFLKSNKAIIEEICQEQKYLEYNIQNIPEKLRKVHENFMKNDFTTSFVRILNNQVSLDDEFEKLTGAYVAELEEIKEKMNEIYPSLDKIVFKAKQINSKSGKTPLKALQEMTSAITELLQIYYDLENQSKPFYEQLLKFLLSLNEDFKNAAKDKKSRRQDFLKGNAFYDQDRMEFPMGQSVFVASSKFGKDGGGTQSIIMQESMVIQRAGDKK